MKSEEWRRRLTRFSIRATIGWFYLIVSQHFPTALRSCRLFAPSRHFGYGGSEVVSDRLLVFEFADVRLKVRVPSDFGYCALIFTCSYPDSSV